MTKPAVADQNAPGPASSPTRRALLGIGAVGAALAVSRTASAAPTPDDRDLAGFAIGAELAASELYAGRDGDLWRVLSESHGAYAELLAGITAVSADHRNDELYDSLSGGFDSDIEATALALENTLAATHVELIGMVTDDEVAAAMASIVAAESRFAAVVANRSGADLDAVLVNSADALASEA